MKRTLSTLLVLFVVLPLGGCGATGALSLISETGEAVGSITDAAVQRDYIYNQTLQNRDKEYGKMYAKSGFDIKFDQITINGVVAYLPTTISYKPEPKFQQQLETSPPDHRGWDSLDRIAELGLKGWLAWVFGDVTNNAVNRSSSQYGVYAPINQSYNPTTTYPYVLQ